MLKRLPFEMLFWLAAIVFLATIDPTKQHHFSLCLFSNLGFSWCPGCGLGRSISSLLHGDIQSSFSHHWLGLPALIIILHRILILFKFNFIRQRVNYESEPILKP